MPQITTIEQLREIIPAPSEKAFAKIRPKLCGQGVAFIERCPFVILTTLGEWGLEVSAKGGEPGFIAIVGLMLLRPGTDEVLRISGRACLIHDPETCARLSAGGKPAVLAIRVEIDRAAFHCPRSLRRAGLWQPDSWDEPMKVSFGQIYAEALGAAEIRELFDRLAVESDAKLY